MGVTLVVAIVGWWFLESMGDKWLLAAAENLRFHAVKSQANFVERLWEKFPRLRLKNVSDYDSLLITRFEASRIRHKRERGERPINLNCEGTV